MLKKYKEIIMYIVFGLGTTLVNWLVYILAVEVLRFEMTFSNALAWIFAVAFAFITNKLFVFESRSFEKKLVFKEAATFVASRALSGVIEIVGPTLIFYIGISGDLFGIEGFFAKLIVNIVVIIMNYVLSKLVVFKNDKGGSCL